MLVRTNSGDIHVTLKPRKPRGNVYYWFHFSGKPFFKTTKTRILKQARLIAKAAVFEAVRDGSLVADFKLLELVEKFLADRFPTASSQGSHHRNLKTRLESFCAFAGAATQILQMDVTQASNLACNYISKRRATGIVARGQVNDRLAVSNFYSWVMDQMLNGKAWCDWPYNPADKRHVRTDDPVRDPLPPISDKDLSELLEHARETEAYPAILLVLTTGSRPSQPNRLTWAALDEEARALKLEPEKRRGRTVRLNSEVLEELLSWKKLHPPGESNLMLRVHTDTVKDIIRRIREEHSLGPYCNLSGCRRKFISDSFDAGISPALVAASAGNSISVIEAHYKDMRTMKTDELADVMSLSRYKKKKPLKKPLHFDGETVRCKL